MNCVPSMSKYLARGHLLLPLLALLHSPPPRISDARLGCLLASPASGVYDGVLGMPQSHGRYRGNRKKQHTPNKVTPLGAEDTRIPGRISC
uniref:Putative secreted protein n=1 Tax=Anopheles darlingi TaxID=43151 RepID=A0A2M4DAM0_ANODA